MENLKEVISQNLVYLRKQNKMTQLELCEKLSYSDKAVSRWENGESLPDVETLYKISEIYEVPISYFFEEHIKEKCVAKKSENAINKIMVTILSCAVVWMTSIIIYFYLSTYNNFRYWQIFIWAIPATALVLSYCNNTWGNKKFTIFIRSLFLWSFITSIYCHFIKYNLWIIFLIGPVIQIILIINQFIQPIKIKKSSKFNLLNLFKKKKNDGNKKDSK